MQNGQRKHDPSYGAVEVVLGIEDHGNCQVVWPLDVALSLFSTTQRFQQGGELGSDVVVVNADWSPTIIASTNRGVQILSIGSGRDDESPPTWKSLPMSIDRAGYSVLAYDDDTLLILGGEGGRPIQTIPTTPGVNTFRVRVK